LTQRSLVGLDGRYVNNAPQCTGWMNLTEKGGSGSFYILWSGLYKLTTAAAIPYYTGQYAPSADNNYSLQYYLSLVNNSNARIAIPKTPNKRPTSVRRLSVP
jgi:hypothetical protein